MTAEFDWQQDPDVVVHNQDAVAVYINQRGEITLRQHEWPEDDSLICFRPEYAEIVARAVLNAAGVSIEELISSAPRISENPSASPAALRQKRYRDRHARNGAITPRDVARDAQTVTPLLTAMQGEGASG